jgi:hypothetical protein
MAPRLRPLLTPPNDGTKKEQALLANGPEKRGRSLVWHSADQGFGESRGRSTVRLADKLNKGHRQG